MINQEKSFDGRLVLAIQGPIEDKARAIGGFFVNKQNGRIHNGTDVYSMLGHSGFASDSLRPDKDSIGIIRDGRIQLCLLFNSNGGEHPHEMMLRRTIYNIEWRRGQTLTFCSNIVQSAAAFLFLDVECNKRFTLEDTSFLWHSGQIYEDGKPVEQTSEDRIHTVEQSLRMAKEDGKVSPAFIERIKNASRFPDSKLVMSGNECASENLCTTYKTVDELRQTMNSHMQLKIDNYAQGEEIEIARWFLLSEIEHQVKQKYGVNVSIQILQNNTLDFVVANDMSNEVAIPVGEAILIETRNSAKQWPHLFRGIRLPDYGLDHAEHQF